MGIKIGETLDRYSHIEFSNAAVDALQERLEIVRQFVDDLEPGLRAMKAYQQQLESAEHELEHAIVQESMNASQANVFGQRFQRIMRERRKAKEIIRVHEQLMVILNAGVRKGLLQCLKTAVEDIKSYERYLGLIPTLPAQNSEGEAAD